MDPDGVRSVPPSPSRSTVPTSEAGEQEELWALDEAYWKGGSSEEEDGRAQDAMVIDTMEELEAQDSPSNPLVSAGRDPPASPTPSLDSLPLPSPSPSPALPPVPPPMRYRMQLSPTPSPPKIHSSLPQDARVVDFLSPSGIQLDNDESWDTGSQNYQAVASTSRLASSPDPICLLSSSSSQVEISQLQRRASSPPASSPEVEADIDPQTLARSLRNRTAAQLNPYSVEKAKYTRSLLKNGWQGAVVRSVLNPELLRKKDGALVAKDNLGGWLVLEEGQALASGSGPSQRERGDDSDASSVDGDDLLERQAARKAAMEDELRTAMGKRKRVEGDGQQRAGSGSGAAKPFRKPKVHPPRVHDPTTDVEPRSKTKSTKRRRQSNAARTHASDDGQPAKKAPRRQIQRAGSEPPSSSPAMFQPHKSRARPSKSFHSRFRPPDGRAALDALILDASSPSSSPSSSAPSAPRARRVASSSDKSEDDPSSDDVSIQEAPVVVKTKLGGKKKKALGMMMPAVFMKKAQADLRLMEREKADGLTSGSDEGSGDAYSSGEERKGVARTRIVPRANGHSLRLLGEGYTDESGDDGISVDQSDEEEEQDAVASWLQDFAPQRHHAADEDIVDRFLKQARKTKRALAPGTTQRRNRGEGKSSKRKSDRQPLKESNNARQEGSTVAKQHRPRRPNLPPPISLDTDRAIFQYSSRRDPAPRRHTDDVLPIRHARKHDNDIISQVPVLRQQNESEGWASFGKFSHDFGITRLPAGLVFSPGSFVRHGHLHSLLAHATTPPTLRSCTPFGTTLDLRLSILDFETALPSLCDAIFDATVECTDGMEESTDKSCSDALRFVGAYISTMSLTESTDTTRVGAGIVSQLDRFELRLSTFVAAEPDQAAFDRRCITVAWHLVDIAVRLATMDPTHSDRLRRLISSLVARLLRHGPEHTMKQLKLFMVDVLPADLSIRDVSIECWLGVISLALNPHATQGTFGEQELWETVTDELDKSLPPEGRRSIAAGEAFSYSAMMVCAISQFSSSGLSTSMPRLAAHWPIAMRALEPIQPSALAKVDHTVSNTALARRDRYLWTLIARCQVLSQRWGWKIDVKDALIPKLFDLVNARRLADLTIESGGDFPSFLQNPREGYSRLRTTDSAFVLFLRLVMQASSDITAVSELDKRRQLTRLFLRLSPMSSGAWSRASPELLRSPSVLVNHYSLFITFAILSPTSASQRLDQARRLLDFANVDDAARRTCIRSILYFALNFRNHGVALDQIISWLANIVTQLRLEYVDLEKRRRVDEGRGGKKGFVVRPEQGRDQLWRCAVLLTMVLRSIQLILRWEVDEGGSTPFPDITLLPPAWTSQLLESPLALDPMIGLEIIKCINCFLDVRLLALPHRQRVQEAPVSQDEFGIFEMDYEDPALDALLGVEAGAPAGGADADLRTSDLAFAQLCKPLSSSLFRLVSNIFSSTPTDRGAPVIADKDKYAEQAVESWTRCLAVMVENDVAEWTTYLRYGDQSWKRIANPLGRRYVGLLLSIQVLQTDSSTFTLHSDEYLDVWFQSIVARKFTVQHDFTTALLNVERPSPIFEDLPFERSDTTGQFAISKQDLIAKRLAILQIVFHNMAPFLTQAPLLGNIRLLTKAAALSHLRSMLGSMRDNLSDIAEETARGEYASFCRAVMESLQACGSAVNDVTVPELRTLAVATSL